MKNRSDILKKIIKDFEISVEDKDVSDLDQFINIYNYGGRSFQLLYWHCYYYFHLNCKTIINIKMFQIYLKALDFEPSKGFRKFARDDISKRFSQRCGYNDQVISIWRRSTKNLGLIDSLVSFGEEVLKNELVNLNGKNPYSIVGGLLVILLNFKYLRYLKKYNSSRNKSIPRGLWVDPSFSKNKDYFNYNKIREIVSVTDVSIRNYKKQFLNILYQKYMDKIKVFWNILKVKELRKELRS